MFFKGSYIIFKKKFLIIFERKKFLILDALSFLCIKINGGAARCECVIYTNCASFY